MQTVPISMTPVLAKPRRRWFAFSLRAMLVLVAVIAVTLGWTMHKVRQQGIAVAALEKLGCNISYDTDESFLTLLERLRGLLGENQPRNVFSIEGANSQVTDNGLVHLKGLTQPRSLILSRTQVTDKGLLHLRGLTQLNGLFLDDTHITDKGLVHLEGLTQLDLLRLDDTQLTDDGLVHLQGLTKLRFLFLSGTQVTDNGLVHLRGLTQLKHLILERTQTTDAGTHALKKALPTLEIYR